jgi:hypothetical protein
MQMETSGHNVPTWAQQPMPDEAKAAYAGAWAHPFGSEERKAAELFALEIQQFGPVCAEHRRRLRDFLKTMHARAFARKFTDQEFAAYKRVRKALANKPLYWDGNCWPRYVRIERDLLAAQPLEMKEAAE